MINAIDKKSWVLCLHKKYEFSHGKYVKVKISPWWSEKKYNTFWHQIIIILFNYYIVNVKTFAAYNKWILYIFIPMSALVDLNSTTEYK